MNQDCFKKSLPGADIEFQPQDMAEYENDAWDIRISLGSGLAILIVPQLLGNLADKTGIHAAYGVVALLLLVAFVVTAWTNRMNRRAV